MSLDDERIVDGKDMFIRFVSGEIDEQAHVAAGLFCAASQLRRTDDLPQYEFEALAKVRDWFDIHLESPFHHLPRTGRYERAVCWFKSSANEYLARAWELVAILERNDVLIWTIKSTRAGRIYYEDEAQVLAAPFADTRLIL